MTFSFIRLNSANVISLPVTLILDLLGLCVELSQENLSTVLLGHYFQLVTSVPGLVGAMLAFTVCCWCWKSLRSSVRVQAACLAAYEAVYLTSVAAISALAVYGTLTGTKVDVLRVIQQLSYFGATYTVLDITAERCFAICKPLQAHVVCTVTFARNRAVVIFLTSVCFNVPYTLDMIYDYSLLQPEHACNDEQLLTDFGIIYRLYVTSFLLYLLPFLAIAVLNVILVYNLCKYRESATAANATTDNSGRELSRLVLVISVWYVVCMVAPGIFFLVRLTDFRLVGSDTLLNIAVVADCLVVLDASLYFLFYFLFWGHFRRMFLETVCGRTGCPKMSKPGSRGSFSPAQSVS